MMTVGVLAPLTISVAPAYAQPPNDTACGINPSNANCNGAPIQKGDYCWNTAYQIVGAVFDYHDIGWDIRTSLYYSVGCESNFAYTELIVNGGGIYHLSNKVRRASGPDGGYLMEHAGWTYWFSWTPPGTDFLSPLVYAPHNAAQACFSNNNSDQAACTAYY